MDKFPGVKFNRKPGGPEDIDKTIDGGHPGLKDLQYYDKKDVGDLFRDDFETAMPTYFIYLDGEEQYLIDTQGYDYPRYAVRITEPVKAAVAKLKSAGIKVKGTAIALADLEKALKILK